MKNELTRLFIEFQPKLTSNISHKHVTNLNERGRHLMVIITLWQSTFSNLLKNANKADYQIFVRTHIYRNKIKKRTKCCTHDSRIIITKPLQQREMGNKEKRQ